jgi:ABC-type uncharacterized transport system involved in gliding motility auxiliary subunit
MSHGLANPASFSSTRRWTIGVNVLVSCLTLLALLVMINFLASRHFKRLNLSPDARHKLSPLTVQILNSLTNEVKVTVFFDPENALYSSVRGLLEEYRLTCPRLNVEYVDYVRWPDRGALVKAQYKLSSASDEDLVIFESSGRPPHVVYDKELSEYDFSGVFTGREARRTGFKGEQSFTLAIVSVTEGKQFKAYFLQGNGEHNPDSEDESLGYLKFRRVLEEKNIAVEPLSLLTNDVPSDCQLLVIAGPRNRLQSSEVEKIETYLNHGGRVFILLMNTLLPDVKKSGLERTLANWGVEVGDNLVRDREQSKADSSKVLLTGTFGQHAIVNPLQGSRIALVMPHSVRQQPGDSRKTDTTKIAELVFTSKEGEAADSRGAREITGTVPLVVAVEKGAIQGVSPDRGSTRMVVAGDSFFLANGAIESEANHDFANLAVSWLLDRTQLLAIGPRPVHEYKIAMTESQMRKARWILLGGMPGAVLLLGALVWLRRRN